MKKNLIFRVDANKTIGRGHFSRSMAAAAMLENDFEIVFVSLESNKTYIENLSFPYKLKTIQENDDFLSLVTKTDMVWLDGYQFSEAFKKSLRVKVHKLIETNDIPYEPQNVDILINHTPGISVEEFGNTTAQLYIGLKYVLLRQSFLEYAQKNHPNMDGNGVFVCFGGADTFNLGMKFVERLIQHDFKYPIYWVTHQSSNEIKNFSFSPNIYMLNNLNENQMIQYMEKAKVLLIPPSVLSFETIALRKAFFTGYFVDNQKYIFKGLKEYHLAKCYGYLETDQDVDEALTSFLSFYKNTEKHQKIVETQKESMDGLSQMRLKSIFSDL